MLAPELGHGSSSFAQLDQDDSDDDLNVDFGPFSKDDVENGLDFPTHGEHYQ
jgi:hypothetical protein